MRIGLHIPTFTWPSGPDDLGPRLGEIVSTADAVGFERISVMDHVFQIPPRGPAEDPMLEPYTALGYIAARTTSAKLLALCTSVVYRDPGLLAKAVTTLDVLSGGRAMLSIGAAWYDQEADGLGLFFPPLAERFSRLEEALQICLQMWSDSEEPYDGTYYHLGRTLNSPQSPTRPHPPILVGGGGEQRTLRLVAQYADACNLFASEDLVHKFDVLRAHCDDVGRDYDSIEKTVNYGFDPGPRGEHCSKIIDELGALSEVGVTVAHGAIEGVSSITPIEIIGEQIIPAVVDL